MNKVNFEDLLKARVHLGHQTKRWNPKMATNIFAERKGIHIIDLNKTLENLEKTKVALKNIVESGRKVMFVATKNQIAPLVEESAKKLMQPYVTERWLGGTLTNFTTIKKSLKRLANTHKIQKSVTFQNLAKREKLMLQRDIAKLERLLRGLVDINRLPSALFVIDTKNEHIAVKEARKLGIPVFGIVDTNSDPTEVDYVIPANDDTYSSVKVILDSIAEAMEEGLENRKKIKEFKEKEKVKLSSNVSKEQQNKVAKKVLSSDLDKNKPQEKNKKVSKKIILKKAMRPNPNQQEKNKPQGKKDSE